MISINTAVINENDQLVCTCTDTENYHGHNQIVPPMNYSVDVRYFSISHYGKNKIENINQLFSFPCKPDIYFLSFFYYQG